MLLLGLLLIMTTVTHVWMAGILCIQNQKNDRNTSAKITYSTAILYSAIPLKMWMESFTCHNLYNFTQHLDFLTSWILSYYYLPFLSAVVRLFIKRIWLWKNILIEEINIDIEDCFNNYWCLQKLKFLTCCIHMYFIWCLHIETHP